MASPSQRRRSPTSRKAHSLDPEIDRRLEDLLDAVGVTANRDLLADMLANVTLLARDGSDRLDIKIVAAALQEMREGFEMFTPYRHLRKVTMFGSARTLPTDPLYTQARDLAHVLSAHHWSTVTGAGPGIMAAGLEGAGPEHAFGINIRLPFEQSANEFIAADPKLVSMKYFFTRKLLLIKESDAYVCLPGGFGTLDEAFELLTLLQTGKAQPAPVVFLDVPGGSYWKAWERFLKAEVEPRKLINIEDRCLYIIVDTVSEAAGSILSFYRNYHSLRWVGDRLVLRLQTKPTPEEARELSREFSDICLAGGIEVLKGPLSVEVRDDDHLGLFRVAFRFDRMSYARLRMLIDALNALPGSTADTAGGSAPTGAS
jgi:uncharacterized protein (TIGR00730 family)